MPYSDPIKQKAYEHKRYLKRKAQGYFRDRYERKRPSNPSLGYLGEELAIKTLVNSKRIHRPSDLEWEGKRVEVKTAIKQHGHFVQWTTKKTTESKTYRWKFFLKQLRQVDLYFIICQDKDKRVEHIFLIPDKELNKKNLSISENRINKYSKYRLSLQ